MVLRRAMLGQAWVALMGVVVLVASNAITAAQQGPDARPGVVGAGWSCEHFPGAAVWRALSSSPPVVAAKLPNDVGVACLPNTDAIVWRCLKTTRSADGEENPVTVTAMDSTNNVIGTIQVTCVGRNPPGANVHCPHASPHSHTYGIGGSLGGRSDAASTGEFGAGFTSVTDANTADCDGDGIAGDLDGDYETGVGGGFFGYGPWANEPTCNYGLAIHGGTATVYDVVLAHAVAFVIGADDTGGPLIETDPVTGETTCSTDGSITPGDPGTDPTADADDCLTDVYVGSGTTCGAGGDGGYWVFLHGAFVSEDGGNPGFSIGPTTGTITA